MLHRTVALFMLAVGVLVFSVADSSAQFGGKGKGGPKGPGGKQDAEIEKLREQIKELEAKLAKAQGTDAKKKDEKGGPPFAGGKGFGRGFGPGGFGPGGFGPGGFGPGKGFPGAPANMDPEKMKKVLQLYELLYGDGKKDDEKSPPKKDDFKKEFKKDGFPFGKKDATPAGNFDARIERLIGELEQLRRELKKK